MNPSSASSSRDQSTSQTGTSSILCCGTPELLAYRGPETSTNPDNSGSGNDPSSTETVKNRGLLKDLLGEIMLRIAVVRKETGQLDTTVQLCNLISQESTSDSIRANALCLKVKLILNHIVSTQN